MPLQLLKNNEVELKTRCSLVESESDFSNLKVQLLEMIQIAKENHLVGLSANQVGIMKRFFIVNLNADRKELEPEFLLFVNPKIKPNENNGKEWGWESCGSIDGFAFLVNRWKELELSGVDIEGKPIPPMKLNGHLGIIAQHENDHLNGILISSKFRERRKI